MSLQQQIQDDLKQAMKARDRARTSALRMALAAVKNASVEKGRGAGGELSDAEVQKVLASEVKRRREAAAAYRDGGDEERAAGEDAEADVYATYLPQPLDDDELARLVDEAIAEVGATDRSAMGQVMKTLMPRVEGRADGAHVSELVRARLG